MNKFILTTLIALFLVGCSKSSEDMAKETVKIYLETKYQDSTNKIELVSLDVKLDTIPEYFNDEIFASADSRPSLANSADVALSF